MEEQENGSIKVTCPEDTCGHRVFTLTAREVARYRNQEWEIPKRCSPCRDRRRRGQKRG